MDRINILELIQLDVIGCISRQDHIILKSLMELDDNFPWTELGEYQNLVVLLPLSLKQEELSLSVKDKVVRKMNKLVIKDGGTQRENEIVLEEFVPVREKAKKLESKEIIDWETLSIADTKIKLPSQPDKLTFQPAERKDLTQKIHISKDVLAEEFTRHTTRSEEVIEEKNFSALSGMRKYFLVAGIVAVFVVILATYISLRSNENNPVNQEQNIMPVNNSVVDIKKDVTDSLIAMVDVDEVQTVAKQKTQSEKKTDKENLPSLPPQLPKPIDAPAIQLAENIIAEESTGRIDAQLENEYLAPPPKEIKTVEEEPTYFVAVEEMPEPIGGLKEIQQKISYPELARRIGLEGKVFIRAFVDETGSVTSAELVKGIGGGCDEVALDAVLKTKFKPGKQRGRPVKVQIIIPIVFKR
jgi:protein TonB